jgi:hypothetical protein
MELLLYRQAGVLAGARTERGRYRARLRGLSQSNGRPICLGTGKRNIAINQCPGQRRQKFPDRRSEPGKLRDVLLFRKQQRRSCLEGVRD